MLVLFGVGSVQEKSRSYILYATQKELFIVKNNLLVGNQSSQAAKQT